MPDDHDTTGESNPLLDALIDSGEPGIDVVYALLKNGALSALTSMPRHHLPHPARHAPPAIYKAGVALRSGGIIIEDTDLRRQDFPPHWYLTDAGTRLGMVLHDLFVDHQPAGFRRRDVPRPDLALLRDARFDSPEPVPAVTPSSPSDETPAQTLRRAADAALALMVPQPTPAAADFDTRSPLAVLTRKMPAHEASPPTLRVLLLLYLGRDRSLPWTVPAIAKDAGVNKSRVPGMVGALETCGLARRMTLDEDAGPEFELTAGGLVFGSLLESICAESGPAGAGLLGALGVSSDPATGRWERLLEALCLPRMAEALLADETIGDRCRELAGINEAISTSLRETQRAPEWALAPWQPDGALGAQPDPPPPALISPPGSPLHALAANDRATHLMAIIDALLVVPAGGVTALAQALGRTSEEHGTQATHGVTADVNALVALGIVEAGYDDRQAAPAPVVFLTPPGWELARLLESKRRTGARPPSPRSHKAHRALLGRAPGPRPAEALAALVRLLPPDASVAADADVAHLQAINLRLTHQISLPQPAPVPPRPGAPLAALSALGGTPLQLLMAITQAEPAPTRADAPEPPPRVEFPLRRTRSHIPARTEATPEMLKALYCAGLVTIVPPPRGSPTDNSASRRLSDRPWTATEDGQRVIELLSTALTAVTQSEPGGTSRDGLRMLRWAGVLDDVGMPSMLGLMRALSIPQVRSALVADTIGGAVLQPLLELNESLGDPSKVAERAAEWSRKFSSRKAVVDPLPESSDLGLG